MARMIWGGGALFLVWMVSACGTGPAPNDVSPTLAYQDQQALAQRQAALRGTGIVPPSAPPAARAELIPPLSASAPVAAPAQAVPVAQPQAQAAASAPVATSPAPIIATASAAIAEAEAAPAVELASASLPATGTSNPEISDEQEFDAVAARQTIESDAERLARMQAERVEVAPTTLPDRPTGIGPNIIDYALSTTHPVGTRQYPRTPRSQARHDRNCLAFRSADLAQEWFLANGGPGRDRRTLDPDGDGYACAWNPGVYRQAAAAARN